MLGPLPHPESTTIYRFDAIPRGTPMGGGVTSVYVSDNSLSELLFLTQEMLIFETIGISQINVEFMKHVVAVVFQKYFFL